MHILNYSVLFLTLFVSTVQPEECSPTYELLTGFVYSVPEDQIDAFQNVLQLSECLEKCSNISNCQSINFETGLCIVLSSRADQKPEALAESQFPVYTLHAQKTCLKEFDKCKRDWAFEKVPRHQLVGYTRKTRRVGSKEECAERCLSDQDFVCRSFNYDNNSGTCGLSDMDRHSVANSKAFRSASGNGDYYESNCAKDPVSLCEFRKVLNKVLKTVDAVHTEVESREKCRELCLTANFRCHSYDYGDSGAKVCRLSHHSAASLINTRSPYLSIPDAVTYEMDTCYNVKVECGATGMTAVIETSRLFDGKMYPKSQPRSCVVDVVDSLKFSFEMKYYDLDCDVKQVGYGKYANDIVIQHHDKIVTTKDLGVSIKCEYDLNNRTVTNGFDVGGDVSAGGTESATVRAPTVVMKITNPDGSKITTAKVGDNLSIRFQVDDPNSPYQIFVRELIAVDGVDSNEIVLIDANGCPTEPTIMSKLVQDGPSGKILTASFNAFKFPSTDIVQFKALVTPCLPACQPAQCEVFDQTDQNELVESFGKRRKRRDMARNGRSNNSQREDLIVRQVFHVSDKFGFNRTKDYRLEDGDTYIERTKNQKTSSGSMIIDEASDCMNIVGLIIACSLFLVAQFGLILAWAYLWRRRQSKLSSSSLHTSSTIDDRASTLTDSITGLQQQRREPRTMISQFESYHVPEHRRHYSPYVR